MWEHGNIRLFNAHLGRVEVGFCTSLGSVARTSVPCSRPSAWASEMASIINDTFGGESAKRAAK